VAWDYLCLVVNKREYFFYSPDSSTAGAAVVDIYKRIEAIKEDVSGMDNIGFSKIDKAVAIGMGVGYMYSLNSVAV